MNMREINKLLKGKVIKKIEKYTDDKSINRIYFEDGTYLLFYEGANYSLCAHLYTEDGEELA